MPALVIDACGGLHLKQLGALSLVDELRVRGASLATPKSVYGELVKMSLSEWLTRSSVERVAVTRTRHKTVLNACERPLPGGNDVDAIAAADDLGAVLFTHDDACARGGRAVGVTVVDVCDLADFRRVGHV